MRNLVLLFIALTAIGCLLNESHGYKILAVFPTMIKSHFIVGSALLKGLAEKGHDVTMISPFPLKTPIKNYRDISITLVQETAKDSVDNALSKRNSNIFTIFARLSSLAESITQLTMSEKAVQNLLKSEETFDIVIVEVFGSEALLSFASHFKAPVIGVSTFGASHWACEMVGSPSPPSYVPHPFIGFSDRMNLLQRAKNLHASIIEYIMYNFYHVPKQEALYHKHFLESKPPLRQLIRNVSLVLVNTHFSLSYPRPYAINMIEVGGMHLKRETEPLPESIQRFLDSAEHGAIYFSMGSSIKARSMDRDKVEAIIHAFGSLKQRVLWKWESKVLPGKPANIMISDWFPQDDILAHPNVKLFVTHGGLLSVTEAVFHGIPIVAIPIFGDQPLNAARAEKMGIGRALEYDHLNKTVLRDAILDVLNNRTYTENMKQISAHYRDQPMTPLDKAIYWVEYVARHKGAPHMRSASQDLNVFEYHNLDIFAIVIFILHIVVYVLRALLYWSFRKCCRPRLQQSIRKVKTK